MFTLRPALSADPLRGLFEVLQVIRRLLTRPECFRLEREFAGPESTGWPSGTHVQAKREHHAALG